MEIKKDNIKVIGFDADDTLWVNETYFRDAEIRFSELLSTFETPNKIDQELFKMEMKNLALYGYGIKGFTLSMIEMAIELSNGTVSNAILSEILDIGKAMINHPVQVLAGVEEVLSQLSKSHTLILATKGDLLDQETKLNKSGLGSYFNYVEVLSDKQEANYSKLISHLNIKPSEFLMVGNSLKSDVLPLLNIGAQAVHIPFHTTWAHEHVKDQDLKSNEFKTLGKITELLEYLN